MLTLSQFKKFFLYTLIGTLIGAAGVAVVTVLAGTFNETAAKALLTLFMVMLHSLVCLCFIWDDERTNTFERLAFFSTMMFMIIVLSFVTSLFGIWHVLAAATVWKVYQTFFVIAFASLHMDILSKALGRQSYLDTTIVTNFLFIFVVFVMFLPIIFVTNAVSVLGEGYFRLLGAVGIIDGTLSILAIIFYKLYTQQHPQEPNPIFGSGPDATKPAKKGLNVWVWLLIAYLALQVAMPMFMWLMRSLR
ncbi:MAG: hypothetical protein WCO55_01470 [Candidatus Falkowbacteria bacterium]